MKDFVTNEKETVVKTSKGLVKGYYFDGVYMFKGIPYAKAERFRQPEEIDPWEDVFDATNYGYVCPLLENPKPNGELKVPHRYWPMSEDCMNLNVWTPAPDDSKRPVLLWFHGGGLEAGSSIEQIAYEGENLAKFGEVVVVSVNHRLNVLGYLDLSAFGEEYENSGNIGTADTVASLKWVHDNIESFGGDPDNVTIMGQSGGGVKTTALLQYPEADGLFHRVVNMSGVVDDLLCDAEESGEEFALDLMKALGCETVDELAKIDYSLLAKEYVKLRAEYQANGRYGGSALYPNKHYLGNPQKVGFRKETTHIPVLVGSVFGEFTGFAAPAFDREEISYDEGVRIVKEQFGDDANELIELFKRAYPERNPADLLYIDTMFRPGDINYVRERSKLNNCTYSYIFNEDFDIDGKCVPWHCSDIPYWFGNTEYVPVCIKDGVSELEDKMFWALISFAETGNPNVEQLPIWPACEDGKEYVMFLGNDCRCDINPDHKLVAKLREIMANQTVDMDKVQH